jgi:lipopolysaccharide cholinephosphotransferase
MKSINNQELRAIQLEIVAYIDKICREQGIAYSLAAGSLLGTVKYKGYIPWDDDIDLMLTRSNYERLMQALMAELPKHLGLLYYKVQPTYLPMAKLYDKRTAFESELETLHEGTGVFVDIFPLDDLPDDREEGEKFRLKVADEVKKLVSSHAGFAYASAGNWPYFLGKLIFWLPTHFRYKGKTQAQAEKVDRLIQLYNGQENHYCNYIFSFQPKKHKGYFEKTIFDACEDTSFEGLTLRKIKNHGPYLSELYGNWQNPPKHEKQHHSHFHWYWKDEND